MILGIGIHEVGGIGGRCAKRHSQYDSPGKGVINTAGVINMEMGGPKEGGTVTMSGKITLSIGTVAKHLELAMGEETTNLSYLCPPQSFIAQHRNVIRAPSCVTDVVVGRVDVCLLKRC